MFNISRLRVKALNPFLLNSLVQKNLLRKQKIIPINCKVLIHRQFSSNEKDPSNQKTSEVNNVRSTDKDDKTFANATKRAVDALQSTSIYSYDFQKLYEDLEKKLTVDINETNRRRLRLIIISTIVGLLLIGFIFGRLIKKTISDETAGIAKETLENESLKIQTQELAMAVVQTILNDKDITSHAALFLREASTVKETQDALLSLTIHVLSHPDSLKEISILTKKLISSLASDKVCEILV